MAVYMTVFAGTAPFGFLITGFVADRFGVGTSLTLSGAVTFLATVVIVWTQRQRPFPTPRTVPARGD
jgi:uncharacterized membrane-anchored protein